jgi:hypothetical protein
MTGPNPVRIDRWPDRSTANRLEPECWPVLQPHFTLEPGSAIFTIGSCFARNIEAQLVELGYRLPTVEFLAEHKDDPAIKLLTLNKYTPPSIFQELSFTRAILDRDDTVRMTDIEPLLYRYENGRVFDLERPVLANLAQTPEEALRRWKTFYQLYRQVFTVDAVVITLGLIECWYEPRRDRYVEFNPVLQRRDRAFKPVQMDYPTALDFVQRSIDLINRDGPKKILLTTSPVPLARTFTDQDVIIANTYSKSVLLAVSGYVANTYVTVVFLPYY